MTRAQLEHVIRAAATIADDDEIVVVGSQAILGQFPDAPPELLVSKYVAHREKDLRFNRVAARHRLVERSILEERLATMYLDEALEEEVRSRIAADFAILP